MAEPASVPFDRARLDSLMEAAGLDALVVSSKHNAGYLLGGHRFFFFRTMDAIGHSRYLPVVVYLRGAPERTAYVASAMESWDHALRPFWTPHFHPATWGSRDAATLAATHLRDQGMAAAAIGLEPAFLPLDAYRVLEDALPEARFGDATGVLERLRAVKRPDELDLLRRASEGITAAMQATVAWAGPGTTKRQIVARMRLEEAVQGVDFDYCLVTMGVDRNRAVSDQAWQPGEPLSLDSGGNVDGYIGDLCRMAVLGPPDGELQDLLGEVDAAQQAAFAAIRAGAIGRDVLAAGNAARQAGPNADVTDLVVHGMGLITHEVPFLMNNRIYAGSDTDAPLEAGMVLSVETTMAHPRRGFVKLEDTVAVTADGLEMFGATGRGWTVAGG